MKKVLRFIAVALVTFFSSYISISVFKLIFSQISGGFSALHFSVFIGIFFSFIDLLRKKSEA